MTTAWASLNHVLTAAITGVEAVTIASNFVNGVHASGAKNAAEKYLASALTADPADSDLTRDMAPALRRDFDFGDGKLVDLVTILRHNITAAGKIWVTLSNNADFSSPVFTTAQVPAGHDLILALPATVTARYMRVEAVDMTRLYLTIGTYGAWAVTTLYWGTDFGYEINPIDPSPRQQTGDGNVITTRRAGWDEVSFPIPDVEPDEVPDLVALAANGNHNPIWITAFWDPSSVVFAGDWFYGLLSGVKRRYVNPLTWSTDLQIRTLPGSVPTDGSDAASILTGSSLAVSVSSIGFGSYNIGTTVDQSFTITADPGNPDPLAISLIAPTGFLLLSSAELTLAPGAVTTVNLRMQTTLAGAKSGNLTIAHNATLIASPISVALSGTVTGTLVYPVFAAKKVENYASSQVNILDNGDLIEFLSGTGGNTRKAKTLYPSQTGKIYAEITVQSTHIPTDTRRSASVIGCSSAEILYSYNPNTNVVGGCGFSINTIGELAASSNGSAITTTDVAGSNWTNGLIVGIAIDSATGKIWIAYNNTWLASGDPAAGTSPLRTLLADKAWSIHVLGNAPSDIPNTLKEAFKINTGRDAFVYTPPSGFTNFSSVI